jgi:hypothetical protein
MEAPTTRRDVWTRSVLWTTDGAVAYAATMLLFLAALGGGILLASIGAGQWLVPGEVVPRSASWVLTTALAWLAGLVVLPGVATPWWHEGGSGEPTLAV